MRASLFACSPNMFVCVSTKQKERTLMAMLCEESNDYGGCGQVPTRTSRREELLSGYAIHRPCTFKSLKQFKKVCETSSAALALKHGLKVCETSSAALADGKQYVAFENVTSKNLEDIEKWREDSNKNLPRMRILYDRVSEVLIVKFMPGSFHDTATAMFNALFSSKFPDVYSLVGQLATKFEARDRAKEGDSGYKPVTRTSKHDWPSLMVEVGVSESLQQLRSDARFWLTKSAGETRVVIVMSIDTVARKVKIERWEDVPRIRPSRPSTPLYNPGLVQSITLEHGVQYAGPALHIPAAKVYDQPLPPNLGANDFELTAQDLESFKTTYWGVLQ